jgi:hypothetical protein
MWEVPSSELGMFPTPVCDHVDGNVCSLMQGRIVEFQIETNDATEPVVIVLALQSKLVNAAACRCLNPSKTSSTKNQRLSATILIIAVP